MCASSWSGSGSGASALADAPMRITPTVSRNLRIYLIVRPQWLALQGCFKLDAFAGVQVRKADMSDARRRQQTGQHAGAVPDAELPAKDRQHAHRSPGRSHQSFSDSRRGEAERLRPGRPEAGQAAVQAPELDLREDPFEGVPANRRLAPWNEKSRRRSAKDGKRDLRRRTARFERDDGPDGSRQCLGSGADQPPALEPCLAPCRED